MLGKILVSPVNVLLLDEPTNHLDMESCDALLAALLNFEGSLIMVTHNEMFLHALAERLVVFQDDQVSVFDGCYADFLAQQGWESNELQTLDTSDSHQKPGRKNLRKLRSEILNQRSAVLKPLEKKIESIENSIEKYENELENHNQAMQKAAEDHDGKQIEVLGQSIYTCQTAIDTLFNQLETITTSLESQTAGFDQKLAQV